MRVVLCLLACLLIAPLAAAQPPYVDLPDGVRWQELLVRPTSSPRHEAIEFRGERGGKIHWLRISPSRGIDRVDIEYVDRPAESFWPDRRGRARDHVIEVDPRARIRRVVITCRPQACGRYGVFAA